MEKIVQCRACARDVKIRVPDDDYQKERTYKCPYCMEPITVNFTSGEYESYIYPVATGYKCPRCGSRNIQNCQLLYDGQTSELSAVTGGIGISGSGGIGGVAVTSGNIQTNLARKMGVPEPIGCGRMLLYLFLAYLLMGVVFGSLIGNTFNDFKNEGVKGILILLLIGSACIGIIVAVCRHNKIKVPQKYEELRERFICFRCGLVFKITG